MCSAMDYHRSSYRLSDTRALNLNCNEAPERGTIAGLGELAGLVLGALILQA